MRVCEREIERERENEQRRKRRSEKEKKKETAKIFTPPIAVGITAGSFAVIVAARLPLPLSALESSTR